MVTRCIHTLLVVADHIINRIEPIGVRRWGIPSLDVVRHTGLDLVNGYGRLGVECPGLKNSVYEISVSVDESMAKFPTVQCVAEQVTMHIRLIWVARVFNVILKDASPEKT